MECAGSDGVAHSESRSYETCTRPTGLVCLGCYNRIPLTRWLKQQVFISHNAGGWEFSVLQIQYLMRVHVLVHRVISLSSQDGRSNETLWDLSSGH